MLKLSGEIELVPCPTCDGKGTVKCGQTVATRTIGPGGVPALQPSTGHPIPCPTCNGKKVVGENERTEE